MNGIGSMTAYSYRLVAKLTLFVVVVLVSFA